MPRRKKAAILEPQPLPIEKELDTTPKPLEERVRDHLVSVWARNPENYTHWKTYDEEAILFLIDNGLPAAEANKLGPEIVIQWFKECKDALWKPDPFNL